MNKKIIKLTSKFLFASIFLGCLIVYTPYSMSSINRFKKIHDKENRSSGWCIYDPNEKIKSVILLEHIVKYRKLLYNALTKEVAEFTKNLLHINDSKIKVYVSLLEAGIHVGKAVKIDYTINKKKYKIDYLDIYIIRLTAGPKDVFKIIHMYKNFAIKVKDKIENEEWQFEDIKKHLPCLKNNGVPYNPYVIIVGDYLGLQFDDERDITSCE